nr:MAG TPA: hypothetical protein [Bacteriophage sp.]
MKDLKFRKLHFFSVKGLGRSFYFNGVMTKRKDA